VLTDVVPVTQMTIASEDERFRQGAQDYAAYLESPEGRLRTDLAFANLQDFLPTVCANGPMHVLDLGCGTGATAVRLAQLGTDVTLLDLSEAMLAIANRAATEAGVTDRVTLRHGDAAQLPNLFHGPLFDVILCHNVLEFVDDPASVLQAAAGLLRDRSAILSILVRNQAGEVLKAALQAGDLAAAGNNLTAEWGQESLYGGNVRLFTANGLRSMLEDQSLTLIAESGVRVIADYLPPGISRESEYERIFALERKLGSRPEFAAMARYIHVLARRMEKSA
jgi:S-adenosylmethionine-dependent methyltransferase